ncbi:unnamed protein product [Caenorhabditis brenneri]
MRESPSSMMKYNRLDQKLMMDLKSSADLLIEAHDCFADKEIALQELTIIAQGKKPLTKFGQRIRIFDYVYEDLTDESKEKLLATHFLSGTLKKIKTRLRQLQFIPKTHASSLWNLGRQDRRRHRCPRTKTPQSPDCS